MPRTVATVIENNFVKGLVTEANSLQYPENSCVETFDCIFDVLGIVSRRAGFDYEVGYTLKAIDKTGCAINTYLWKNVSGDGLVNFLVVQVGNTLYFYASTSATTSLSSNIAAGTINLATYQAGGSADPKSYECQFSDGLSKLYVVHPCLENFYITYNGSVFSATQYTIKIRDFEGLNDGLAVDNRPGALPANDPHRYNIYNQGWTSGYTATWNGALANFPSNADVWWIYKNAAGAFDPATTAANNTRGTGSAPKGHFLLPLYTGDRNTASGLASLAATSAGSARTSSTAFFAGRVWHSGIQAAGFNSKIYFSQIITSDTQVGACYQAADPAAEDVFSLQPDDGGVIAIPEAGTIYRLFPTQTGILVFAYRGVWLISGSTGLGFKATDYVVSKLSSIRTVSGSSFLDVDGLPIWWNTDGIWQVVPTKDGSGLQIQSMTWSTIQTFYDDIPAASKLTARGVYNPLTRVASWVYRSVAPGTIEEQYAYDRVLNLNTQSQSFYPWTISPGVKVHGLSVLDGAGGVSVETTVIDTAVDTVLDDAGDIVVAFDLQNIAVASRTKFLTSIPSGGTYNFTFAETEDQSFEDWVSPGLATSYTSYFITGYRIHGQGNKNFQNNYLTTYNVGAGTVYVQGVWDFATATSTGRYSTKQKLVFLDDDYTLSFKRSKIRGQGHTLQYKFTSLPFQNFTISGWSAWETGNSTP